MIFNRCEISFQSVMIRLNKKRDINKRIFYANSHVGIVDNFFYVTRVNLSCRKLKKMLTKSEAEKSPHIYQRAEVLFKEIRRRPRGRLLSMTPSGFVQMAKGHANVINLNMIYVPSFKVLNINWNPNKLAWESRSTGLYYNWGKIVTLKVMRRGENWLLPVKFGWLIP